MKIFFIPEISIGYLPYCIGEFGYPFDVLNNSSYGNFIFLNKKGDILFNLEDNSLHLIFNLVIGLEQALVHKKNEFFVFSLEPGYYVRIEINKMHILMFVNEDKQHNFFLVDFINELQLCSSFCLHIFKFYLFNLKLSEKFLNIEKNLDNSFSSIKAYLDGNIENFNR